MIEQEKPRRKKYALTRTRAAARPLAQQLVDQQEMDQDELERRRAVLTSLFAKAQALVPDPPDSPTRKACRESSVDEIIAEKFRQQGFNL